jgi:hypothetical protein
VARAGLDLEAVNMLFFFALLAAAATAVSVQFSVLHVTLLPV